MSACKQNVLDMIDEAIGANYAKGICECHCLGSLNKRCSYCKIKEGLQRARACIVASISRIDTMRSNIIAAQLEIEEKLKRLIREEGD